MELTRSPLHYLGNRGEETPRILSTLVQGKRFQTCYDPFCGSGSFTQAAVKLQLAKRYVMSDSYLPLVNLLERMVMQPQRVVSCYERHYQHLLQQNSTAQQAYYTEVKNHFHQSGPHEDFLFLNNFARYHIPVIDKEYYCSELDMEAERDTLSPARIMQQLYGFSALLKPVVTLKSGGFEKVLQEVTKQDLVILDPPYPDLPSDVPIYHRLCAQASLHQQLVDMLAQLAQKQTAFILLYGTWGMDKRYLLDTKVLNLQHLVRLSPAHNSLFGEYLEHCYLSSSLAFSEEALAKLPFVLYEVIQQKSATEAIAHIKWLWASRGLSSRKSSLTAEEIGKSGLIIWLDGRQVVISPREKDVLLLLKQGLGAKETAASLNLSVRTVESYLEHLRNKTGCRTKLQLISQLQFI